jgi:hypothetical protein
MSIYKFSARELTNVLNALYIAGTMKHITSGTAREKLAIDGKAINPRTFDKMIKSKIIKVVETMPDGTRLFDSDQIDMVAKRLPKKRGPSRYGIVNKLKKK